MFSLLTGGLQNPPKTLFRGNFQLTIADVGNGLDRSDYPKVRCNLAEQSILSPTLTDLSLFVNQI